MKEDTTNGIQDVRVQITAGKVTWDVTEQELPTCETLKREGKLEPLDYGAIKTAGIPKSLINSHYIGFINFTKVIAYRKDKFGDKGSEDLGGLLGREEIPRQAGNAWQGQL